jgi:glucokinase
MASEGRPSVQHYMRDLDQLCRVTLRDAAVSLEAVRAVGISAPGPLDVKRGLLVAPVNNPTLHNCRIVATVQEMLGVPVAMNNDGNAAALAEYMFGEFRGTANMVYCTFSTGMGGGIIAEGRLVQGISDCGGEIGHQIIDSDGLACSCGLRGCWEAYVGGRSIAENLRRKIVGGSVKTSLTTMCGGDLSKIDVRMLLAAAKAGDAFALAEWEELTERLAQGIGNLIMILNPQVIILGTIAIHAGDFVMVPLREKLKKYAWPQALNACRVVPSTLEEKIADLAALAVAAAA